MKIQIMTSQQPEDQGDTLDGGRTVDLTLSGGKLPQRPVPPSERLKAVGCGCAVSGAALAALLGLIVLRGCDQRDEVGKTAEDYKEDVRDFKADTLRLDRIREGQQLSDQAEILLKTGKAEDTEAALELLRKVIRLYPEYEYGGWLLARHYGKDKRGLDDAIRELTDATVEQRDREHPQEGLARTLYTISLLWEQRGDWNFAEECLTEALQHLDRVQKHNKEMLLPNILFDRARIRTHRGNLEGARSDVREALKHGTFGNRRLAEELSQELEKK
jgi:tetratricopeptide (TPR) repeat protein